ncbi:MAG TPA: hypothetical protein VK172_12565 [Lentimicrobium sp.]|nr:hypothetical protein [Lentimicrobium sp.]
MAQKVLFQTLADRDNADFVEENAPFICENAKAWLGNGYYFWDTFIENAHWWGEQVHSGKYIICKFRCDFDDRCFDLVGNTEHMQALDLVIREMQRKLKIDLDTTTVRRILEFFKQKIGFDFEAIRVSGINSKSGSNYIFRLKFNYDKPQYLDYKPAIQICIYTKKGLNLRNCKIVHPEEYVW